MPRPSRIESVAFCGKLDDDCAAAGMRRASRIRSTVLRIGTSSIACSLVPAMWEL
jgi:hypothetical protein